MLHSLFSLLSIALVAFLAYPDTVTYATPTKYDFAVEWTLVNGHFIVIGLLTFNFLTRIPLASRISGLSKLYEDTKNKVAIGNKEVSSLQSQNGALHNQVKTLESETNKLKESLHEVTSALHNAEIKAQKAASPATRDQQIDAELVNLLSLLQEKARFMDFVMDDISNYQDTQVGAAARVVHQGCRSIISEYFSISPVYKGREGEEIALEKGFKPESYRLVGNVGSNPPLKGTVLHKGWQVETIQLPRVASQKVDTKGEQVIAPAEVEIR